MNAQLTRLPSYRPGAARSEECEDRYQYENTSGSTSSTARGTRPRTWRSPATRSPIPGRPPCGASRSRRERPRAITPAMTHGPGTTKAGSFG